MSNLPPGVTESMIPGNRPEDIAYEQWWDEISEKAVEFGLANDNDDLLENDSLIALIDWISDKSFQKGYNQALADAALEALYLISEDDEGGDSTE